MDGHPKTMDILRNCKYSRNKNKTYEKGITIIYCTCCVFM